LNDIELKEMPNDIELEQVILGMVLLKEKRIEILSDTVKIGAFYDINHQEIYRAMLYLYNSNVSIGYETLLSRLKTKELSNDIVDYVLQLGDTVLRNDDFDNKVELLKEIYNKRELYKEALFIVTNEINGISSSNITKKITGAIENLGITSNVELTSMHEYINDWENELKNPKDVTEFLFPFQGLNDLVTLEPTNFMLIASRPGSGKSAFATACVKGFCEQGFNPLFVSLEMSKKEFMDRLISIKTGIPVWKFKSKNVKELTNDEWILIKQARKVINEWNFNFYDRGSMYIEMLYGLAKHLKRKGELDIIVVDYLQLLTTHKYKGQKVNEVGEISRQLKQIAMELKIPVIALSQLNRSNVTSGEKPREPQLSDLRSSGDLEQDKGLVIIWTLKTKGKNKYLLVQLLVMVAYLKEKKMLIIV